jgi:CBS domain containing-hemolysin-like protein
MGLLLFYLFLALVVSFYCSILEAVLLSITPSFIESKMNNKVKWAEKLLHFKTDVDEPLSAILSLNTISHTVGAAGVGAQASIVFEDISVGIVSGVLTLLILIVSELIPKTIGASYWKQLAYFTTVSLNILTKALYPFVVLSRLITGVFKSDRESKVERSEVAALAELGRREGVFSMEESMILKNLVSLRSIKVKDVMTPRTVMVAASQESTIADFIHEDRFKHFSRIPIYESNKDNIAGFVHKHDVMVCYAQNENDKKLKEIKRDVSMISEDESLFSTYKFFTKNQEQIAIATEEFGGTAGLVTMEDVLETLLGFEIIDEFDQLEDLRQYARERWKKRAEVRGLNISEIEDDDTEAID